MTEHQRTQCHSIIHLNAVAAAGIAAGLAQLPGSDNAPLSALEIEMTISLASQSSKSQSSLAHIRITRGNYPEKVIHES